MSELHEFRLDPAQQAAGGERRPRLGPPLGLLALLSLTTVLACALLVTGRGPAGLPALATGRVNHADDQPVGLAAIGQPCGDPRYFWGRPSAAPQARDCAPAGLTTASASPLDPEIGPAAAESQVERVAGARGLPPEYLRAEVRRFTRARTGAVPGEPVVSVVELNLALDAARRL